MANRLATETSPYLLQHRDNPVDWWPWCDEAWEEARRLDRPVLLSIGYSACHWCHVMAHESFEDPQIAALQNELFVSIKVDREERPDVDGVYMQAVVALTGQGGWPMTVFCTPQGVPFYGGTYFPPEDRMQMRGFPSILRAVAQAYHDQREAVDQTGKQLRQRLAPPRLGPGELSAAQLDEACRGLVQSTDPRYGGFGRAPKFPHAAALDLLLRRHRATGDPSLWQAATLTLDRMARGGIHDQLGGGFHRYAVDGQWAVPHFEKMLYDNAQLAPVYLHAWQLSGEERWRRVATEVLDYALREMRLPEGGFASSQDADSGGVEGSFFVWTPGQLREVLGEEDAALAARVFGVVPGGNFEGGSTVLSLPSPLEQVAASMMDVEEAELRERVDGIRARLYAAREQRVHPGRDDKVVTAWNALMLRALAEVGGALDRADYVDAARQLAAFLLGELVRAGVVLRTWKDGQAKITGFLEDVATLADGLLTLHEVTGEPRWFESARRLCEDMVERYYEPVSGFYDTAVDGDPLLVRPSTLDDNAVPAGRSTAALALLRLSLLTGEARWRDIAERTVSPLAAAVGRAPVGLGNLAWALDLALAETREVAIAGDPGAADTREMVRAVLDRFDPWRVLAWGDADGVPLLAERPAVDGRATAYVCHGFVCDAPTTEVEALRVALGEGVARRG